MIILAAAYMEASASRQVAKYKIMTTRVNLMTMKQQLNYLVALYLNIISGQIVYILIEAHHDEWGIEEVFTLWWLHHFAEMMILHVAFNAWHFFEASRKFAEFDGFIMKPFPGTQSVRPMEIVPRRDTDVVNDFKVRVSGNLPTFKLVKESSRPGAPIYTRHK